MFIRFSPMLSIFTCLQNRIKYIGNTSWDKTTPRVSTNGIRQVVYYSALSIQYWLLWRISVTTNKWAVFHVMWSSFVAVCTKTHLYLFFCCETWLISFNSSTSMTKLIITHLRFENYLRSMSKKDLPNLCEPNSRYLDNVLSERFCEGL